MGVRFEESVKGVTTSGEGYGLSSSASDLRSLRLRLKKNRARRTEIRTIPPITPPMIASVGLLGEELDEGAIPVLVEEELSPETDVEEVTGSEFAVPKKRCK